MRGSDKTRAAQTLDLTALEKTGSARNGNTNSSPSPTAAQVEPPEHRSDRRRFLIWALMLGAVPPQRVVERIVAEIEDAP